jgi:Tetratricopeptide repeat/Cytochrome c554 and c-prime
MAARCVWLLTFGVLATGHAALAQNPENLPARNARRNVAYVGDAACAPCHAKHVQTYHRHPMGRSFTPMAPWADQEKYGREFQNPFQAAGFSFHVDHQGPRVVHTISRPDARGEVVCESAAEVQYVIGAGIRGRSYVIDRDGYLFQSPISWYAERQRWDLSPHLAGATEQLYRPVQPQCLFCHANDADHVTDTGNRYRRPIFRQYAIGCERCHGPGQLHIQRRERGEALVGSDDTIVNPRRLPPALREAVCRQCHLQGIVPILPRGRQAFDYRPGLPLESFWSIFVRKPASADLLKFSSHVEQLAVSRCFRDSNGKMGCISCHDPHQLPPADTRVSYYRQRCLACHSEQSCKLPAQTRRTQNADDSCTACHMPRLENSNIAHMASTDHRLLRRTVAGPHPAPTESGLPDASLIDFLRQNTGVSRDRGIALMDLAGTRQPNASRLQFAQAALPLLEQALREVVEDAPALQAKGYALWLLDQKEGASEAFAAALRLAPGREETLAYAAGLAAQSNRIDEAISMWRKLIDVNPWSVRARFELARLLTRQERWQDGQAQCEAALRSNPFHAESRMLLVRCALGQGDESRAREELERLVALNPRQTDSLRRWFAEQLAARQSRRRE